MAAGTSPPAIAQTAIIADEASSYDVGTIVGADGNVTTITGGTLSGANLFHSFAGFDLARGDIAQWVRGAPDAASIANVINRVTGGDVSKIDGTLRLADMPGADFWFINPAGVVFGEGAALDMPGAVHVSTGEELYFTDSLSFSTVTPDGSTFSAAAPEAFGFLGGQGDVIFDFVGPTFAHQQTELSVSAANIGLDGEFAASQLNLAAIGDSPDRLALSPSVQPQGNGLIAIGTNGFAGLAISGLAVVAGTVAIEQAILSVQPRATSTSTLRVSAGSLFIADTDIATGTAESVDSGSILLSASDAQLLDSNLQTISEGTGSSGAISIKSNSFTAIGTGISTATAGSGNAGDLFLAAETAVLSDSSALVSLAQEGSTGKAGLIGIEVGSLVLDEGLIGSLASGEGDAQAVQVSAGELIIRNESGLLSTSQGSGLSSGADILIEADAFLLDASDIQSATASFGDAGNISIIARDVELRGFSTITSGIANLASTRPAGTISVISDTLTLDDSAFSSSTASNGDGGAIMIDARIVALRNEAALVNLTVSSGNAGLISVNAEELTLEGRSAISTETVTLDSSNPFPGLPNTLETGGDGGELRISASRLSLDLSTLTSSTRGIGNAGSLVIDAGSIELSNGSSLISEAAPGSTGSAGKVEISVNSLTLDAGKISSSTNGSGNAGSVFINRDGPGASTVSLDNLSEISSVTFANGNAGIVNVSARQVDLAGQSSITSQTELATTGAGGNVIVLAETLDLNSRSLVSSATAGFGNAGNVLLLTDHLVIEDGAITTSTVGFGNGGMLSILADTIDLKAGGFIVSAAGPDSIGDAGEVLIFAERLTSRGGSIEARSVGVGAAGSILVSGDRIELLEGGAITTNSDFGPAGDISLFLPEGGHVRLAGRTPGIITTTSGVDSGGRITISDPFVIVSDGGSILALGEIAGANVRISSDYFVRSSDRANLLSVNGDLVLDSQFNDLSAGTETPEIDFLNASSVLSGQCSSARATGETSRFTSRITGPFVPGIPAKPDLPPATVAIPQGSAPLHAVPCG